MDIDAASKMCMNIYGASNICMNDTEHIIDA